MAATDQQTQTRNANRKVLEQVFGLISSKRAGETAPLLSEDLYFELPYGPGRKPVECRGRDNFVALNAKTWPAFTRFALEIVRVHELVDPQKLIVEYVSDGEVRSTGKPYVNRYIGVFGFRDGLICEWHEYHNPEVPTFAFTPT
jgi:uncharacterized protein